MRKLEKKLIKFHFKFTNGWGEKKNKTKMLLKYLN